MKIIIMSLYGGVLSIVANKKYKRSNIIKLVKFVITFIYSYKKRATEVTLLNIKKINN